jgi:hypothetical protein
VSFPARQVRKIIIPKIFSFLDDPDAALETLNRVRRIAAEPSVRLIQIDHRQCEVLGLCASTAMDLILLDAKEERNPSNRLHFHGYMSRVSSVNLMLRASGILRHLKVPEAELPLELETKVKRCDLFRGRQDRIEIGRARDVAATSLTDYFDSCLRGVRHELTLQGKNYLSSLLTEIIGNAEEHGGTWSTIGHWVSTGTDDNPFGECHIVILNHGRTIYESLDQVHQSAELKRNLRTLSDLHRSQGFFGFMPGWEEEPLWTLYALQERVSRYMGTPRGVDRGNGTIKFIEFFQQLAGESGRMCINSGAAYILFDGKYRLQEVSRGHERLKVIAFNADNDLERPPERKYVRQLDHSFQGTVVSIRLTLDASLLKGHASSNGGNNERHEND